jgi:hypothetical protein
MRKTQLDRDPTSLFLRKPVDGAACERVHKRRFAVVDMACQADDILGSPCGDFRRRRGALGLNGGLHYFIVARCRPAVSRGRGWYKECLKNDFPTSNTETRECFESLKEQKATEKTET